MNPDKYLYIYYISKYSNSGKVTVVIDTLLLAVTRARIFKLLMSPRIDSKKPITPGCVTWRAGTTTLFLLGSYLLAPIDCLKVPAHELNTSLNGGYIVVDTYT